MSVVLFCTKHQITADKSKALDTDSYTRGRWLDRDIERREARDIRFNFDALLDIAIGSSAGATAVVSGEKKESSFNRAFVILLDNGAKVVAKVLNSLASPPRLTVSSEVATIQYGKHYSIICHRMSILLASLHSQRIYRCSCPKHPGVTRGSRVQLCWIWVPGHGGCAWDIFGGCLEPNDWCAAYSMHSVDGEDIQELCSLESANFGSLYFDTPGKPAGSISPRRDWEIVSSPQRQA
jgi:hypothetical protein